MPTRGQAWRRTFLERYLVHVAGYDLSLAARELLGLGTPQGVAGFLARLRELFAAIWSAIALVGHSVDRTRRPLASAAGLRLALGAWASPTAYEP